MPTVLLTRSARTRFADLLEGAGPGVRWLCLEEDGTIANAATLTPVPGPDFDVAWASTDVLYGPSRAAFFRLVADSSSLRWLQSSFAGLDMPIFRPLLQRGIQITVSHENSISISEYVLAMVLNAYQQPDEWTAAQSAREWRHTEFREVFDSRWTIVGLGSIGGAVARRAAAFGAHVTGIRRTPAANDPVAHVVGPDMMLDAVSSADVVVLALPASLATHHLVNAEFLASMHSESILVNVARGSLIDETALLRSLDAGTPSLAILDVFQSEPLPRESALWTHPKVIVTPHVASAGLGRHRRNAKLFVDNLLAMRRGQPLRNEIRLEELTDGLGDAPAQFSS